MADTTPYSTVLPFLEATGARPTWAPAEDQDRIGSYKIYEDIYWNNPDTFKIVLRGSDAKPIYIPTSRTIVEATHRFVAPMPGLGITASLVDGSDAAVALATATFASLFAREKFWTRFNGAKRYGLIRGDWCFHVMADPSKAAGTRLRILPIDPASYIPEFDEDDLDRIIAVNLVEPYVGSDGKEYVKRQRYWKEDGSPLVWSSCAVWTMEEFVKDVPGAPVRVILPPIPLPAVITAFPVYHIKNFEEPQNPFGSSELRGFERVLTAINQGATDEDLALALDGLGVYATDAPPPADEDDPTKDGPWVIGPGRVIEVPGGKFFNRVQGLNSITPYQEHIAFMTDALMQASGTPDIAVGKIDVQVAESGIALQLHLSPKLALAAEKNELIVGTLSQMFFDLKAWFIAYEKIDLNGADIVPTFGSPIPENKKAEVDQILEIHIAVPSIVTPDWTRKQLARITGLDFSGITDSQLNDLARERTDAAAGSIDPLAEATDPTITDPTLV